MGIDHNAAIKRLRTADTEKRHEVFAHAMKGVGSLNEHSLAAIGNDVAFVATLDADALRKLVDNLAIALASEIHAYEAARHGS